MIDKLGLDGLGGASVRVEPAAPEPLGVSEGTATQVVAGLAPDRGLLGRIDDLQNELVAMTRSRDYHVGRAKSWERDAQNLRNIGSPVVEGTIQHMAMELAAMTQERDELREQITEVPQIIRQLAASQAYAAQLREALEMCKREMQGDKWDALYIDGVLAGK